MCHVPLPTLRGRKRRAEGPGLACEVRPGGHGVGRGGGGAGHKLEAHQVQHQHAGPALHAPARAAR
eukprot:8396490-Pyramimonas_sp.AAC.1